MKSRRVGSAEDVVVTVSSPFPSCRSSARAEDRREPFYGCARTPPRRQTDRPHPARGMGGAIRRRSIGTLAQGAQARYRTDDQESHKRFTRRNISLQTPVHAAAAKVVLSAMRIALYQPDIAQNTGTILRLAACLGVEAHIVEPAGFPTSDRAFRRAGMDYLDRVSLMHHASWQAFEAWRAAQGARLILFTTRASVCYLDHTFGRSDVLLFGRESSGLPEKVHAAADVRLV